MKRRLLLFITVAPVLVLTVVLAWLYLDLDPSKPVAVGIDRTTRQPGGEFKVQFQLTNLTAHTYRVLVHLEEFPRRAAEAGGAEWRTAAGGDGVYAAVMYLPPHGAAPETLSTFPGSTQARLHLFSQRVLTASDEKTERRLRKLGLPSPRENRKAKEFTTAPFNLSTP